VSVLDLHLGDSTTQSLDEALARALPLMAEVRARGGGVLVNCAAGISRSSSIAVAHLVQAEGITVRAAWGKVRAARPKACPNLGFTVQLMAAERRLLADSPAPAAAAAREGTLPSIPPLALQHAPLYNIVFDSHQQAQAYIRDRLRATPAPGGGSGGARTVLGYHGGGGVGGPGGGRHLIIAESSRLKWLLSP